jgi:hypothetical protein
MINGMMDRAIKKIPDAIVTVEVYVSKKNRDHISAKNRSVAGKKEFFTPLERTGNIGKNQLIYFRGRKARRAQARIDKKDWTELTPEEKLQF